MNQLLVIDGVSVRQYFESNYCLNDLQKAALLAACEEFCHTSPPGLK